MSTTLPVTAAAAVRPLAPGLKERVLRVLRTRPVELPFATAALLSQRMVDVTRAEAQGALEALVAEGAALAVGHWGYVAAEAATLAAIVTRAAEAGRPT